MRRPRLHQLPFSSALLRQGALVVAVAALVAAGGFAAYRLALPPTSQTPAPERIPEMVLPTFAGTARAVAKREADWTVYVIWASWCIVCEESLRAAAAVAHEYPQKVEAVAVNRMERRSEALAYLERIGIAKNVTLLADESDEFYRRIGGHAMPEVMIVDRRGEVVRHERGPLSLDEMRKSVEIKE